MRATIHALAGPRRISWRRLLVWTVATVLLVRGYIDADQWVWLSMAYIGGDSLSSWARSRIAKEET